HTHHSQIYTLSLHDALPISNFRRKLMCAGIALVREHGSVVVKDVEATIFSYGGVDQRLHLGLIRDVSWNERGLAASLLDFLRDRDRKSTRLNSSHVSISYAV